MRATHASTAFSSHFQEPQENYIIMSATITALQRKLETDSAAYQTLQKGKPLLERTSTHGKHARITRGHQTPTLEQRNFGGVTYLMLLSREKNLSPATSSYWEENLMGILNRPL
jgi:hypothetical protein